MHLFIYKVPLDDVSPYTGSFRVRKQVLLLLFFLLSFFFFLFYFYYTMKFFVFCFVVWVMPVVYGDGLFLVLSFSTSLSLILLILYSLRQPRKPDAPSSTVVSRPVCLSSATSSCCHLGLFRDVDVDVV